MVFRAIHERGAKRSLQILRFRETQFGKEDEQTVCGYWHSWDDTHGTEKRCFDFTLNSIEGQATPLGSFKGSGLLVNVASRCDLRTPQYAGLEALYTRNRRTVAS